MHEFDRTLAAREDDPSWVAFESQAAFDSMSPSSCRRAKSSRKRRSSKADTDRGETDSWMNRPVNADASWLPVQPPSRASEAENGRDQPPGSPRRRFTMQDKIPTMLPSQRGKRSVNISCDDSNPTLTTSESSESSREPVTTPRARVRASRGRSMDRTSSQARGRTPSSNRDPVGREAGGDRDPAGRTPSRSRGRASQSSAPPSPRRHIVSPGPGQRSRPESSAKSPRRRVESPAPSSRARSRSRSRSVSRRRPSSQTPSTRGRARPPATTTGRRGRSSSRTPATRARSISRSSHRSSTNRPPRTLPPRPPSGARSVGDDNSVRTNDSNIGRDISFGTAAVPSSAETVRSEPPGRKQSTRRDGSIFERLFGDRVSEDRRARAQREASFRVAERSDLPERIHPRILLTATVYHNTATNLWIATINTNQKGVATNPTTASKYLKAFSFPTEREARESAIANAPPKMIPFNQSPNCFICDGKFAVFRRACHCRNCGVCICSNCARTWSAKTIPETYNLKNESNVRVCTSCDTLSTLFRKALQKGDYEETISLYGTGNINLRAPFPIPKGDKKGEGMHPVHCAVEGGNLDLLRWLVEDHYCPIKKISNGNNKKKKGRDVPITTTKGKTVLSIAMKHLNVDMLRYLVVDKKISIFEVKDLQTSLRALEAVLLTLPSSRGNGILQSGEITVPRWDDASYDEEGSDDCSSLGEDPAFLHAADASTIGSRSRKSDAFHDVCIICYDSAIDCVLTPCGHQICCLKCATNMRNCPVCNTTCQFIKIFKP